MKKRPTEMVIDSIMKEIRRNFDIQHLLLEELIANVRIMLELHFTLASAIER